MASDKPERSNTQTLICDLAEKLHRRVFVVEDDAHFSELFVEFLKQNGVEADVAFDGKQAMEIATQRKEELGEKPFMAVFLDMKLPYVDGDHLLIFFKNLIPLVPVVVLTGYVDQDTRKQALDGGALVFIGKPDILTKDTVQTILAQVNIA